MPSSNLNKSKQATLPLRLVCFISASIVAVSFSASICTTASTCGSALSVDKWVAEVNVVALRTNCPHCDNGLAYDIVAEDHLDCPLPRDEALFSLILCGDCTFKRPHKQVVVVLVQDLRSLNHNCVAPMVTRSPLPLSLYPKIRLPEQPQPIPDTNVSSRLDCAKVQRGRSH